MAIYFDNQFYVGTVLDVTDEQTAVVKYLENCGSRPGLYRWLKFGDIFTTSAFFVLHWCLEVGPLSNNGRIWKVAQHEDIDEIKLNLKHEINE